MLASLRGGYSVTLIKAEEQSQNRLLQCGLARLVLTKEQVDSWDEGNRRPMDHPKTLNVDMLDLHLGLSSLLSIA